MNYLEVCLQYFTLYHKEIFKEFRAVTQEIVDSIPASASLSEALELFVEAYKKNIIHYDNVLSEAFYKHLGQGFNGFYPSREIILFYILMALRYRYPQFFPAPSLCVLLSHALRGQMNKMDLRRISIKNIEMLPVVLLLAHDIRHIIVEEVDDLTKRLENFLVPNDNFERSNWFFFMNPDREPDFSSIALVQFPLPRTKNDKNYFGKLENYQANLLYTSWNFLASAEYKRMRHELYLKKCIESIIQLPLPKREGNKNYPAIIRMAKDKSQSIQMLDLHTFNQECLRKAYTNLEDDGLLKKSELLRDVESYKQEIYGNIINNEDFDWAGKGIFYQAYKAEYEQLTKIEIPHEIIRMDRFYSLSPVKYITEERGRMQASGNWCILSDVAEVLRCQEPRIAYEKDKELDAGQQVLKEISLKEIDSSTNIALFDEADSIVVKPQDNRFDKFILQENDTVLAFKGSRTTLGKIAFIDLELNKSEVNKDDENDEVPATCSSSLVIVRAKKNINPIWLFYQLQEKHAQEAIVSRATGSSVLSVNLNALREVPIAFPADNQELELLEYHAEIRKHMKEIVRHRREIEKLKIRRVNNSKLVVG